MKLLIEVINKNFFKFYFYKILKKGFIIKIHKKKKEFK